MKSVKTQTDAKKDPIATARSICLRLLAQRPHSRHELASKLAERDTSPDVSCAVLDRLTEVGLIDDAAFAQAWVQARQNKQKLSRQALNNELQQRGVAEDHIHQATGHISTEHEEEIAHMLVSKRLKTMSNISPEVQLRRLYNLLVRRGYSTELAYRIVSEELNNNL
jgi:regulatory protein